MANPARFIQESEHTASLRRLVVARWTVLAALAVLTLGIPPLLAIPLPAAPLLAIVGVAALFNGFARWRLTRRSDIGADELFVQLLFDIAALSAIVFFSGGAANPLVSLLLPPVAIAALTLPASRVAAVCAAAIAAYSLLMVFYLPLPLPDASRATHLHLVGMWLIFALSAAGIAWIIVRMMRLVRQQDAELAARRERGLRDERVMAIGTLAAGAAHELGTPLATISLLAGEMADDPALPPTLRDDVALLRRQVAVCKEIITGLSRRAGAERLENTERLPADRWLDDVRRRWHASRPQAGCRLLMVSDGAAPELAADPRLEQALLNLLNNAANATPAPLELRLGWSDEEICIEVRDRGPGFPKAVLERGGRSGFPAHERGSGVGLMLTRSAIEQLGGRLTLLNPDEGGAVARIELPRTTP